MMRRLNAFEAAPGAMKAFLDFSVGLGESGVEHGLAELVKIRSSQINGCAHCIEMHTRDARAAGETEERVYMLDAWRESALYTDRERAALEWTEHLTLVSSRRAPDAAYEALRAEFTSEEQVKLTLLINVINGWNRIAIGFGGESPVRRGAS